MQKRLVQAIRCHLWWKKSPCWIILSSAKLSVKKRQVSFFWKVFVYGWPCESQRRIKIFMSVTTKKFSLLMQSYLIKTKLEVLEAAAWGHYYEWPTALLEFSNKPFSNLFEIWQGFKTIWNYIKRSFLKKNTPNDNIEVTSSKRTKQLSFAIDTVMQS